MVKYSILHTMFFFLVCMLGFSTVASAVTMTRLTPTDMHRLCTTESSTDKRNCEAFIRATGERLQISKVYFRKACRQYPISIDDASRIGDMLSGKVLNEEHLSTDEVMSYWADYAGGVPCANQPLWTAQQLLEECQSDSMGRSPCSFYTHAMLEFIDITDALSKRGRTYCTPNGIITDYDVSMAFIGWLQRNPNMNNAPAAYVIVAALTEYFPCTSTTRR